MIKVDRIYLNDSTFVSVTVSGCIFIRRGRIRYVIDDGTFWDRDGMKVRPGGNLPRGSLDQISKSWPMGDLIVAMDLKHIADQIGLLK